MLSLLCVVADCMVGHWEAPPLLRLLQALLHTLTPHSKIDSSTELRAQARAALPPLLRSPLPPPPLLLPPPKPLLTPVLLSCCCRGLAVAAADLWPQALRGCVVCLLGPLTATSGSSPRDRLTAPQALTQILHDLRAHSNTG